MKKNRKKGIKYDPKKPLSKKQRKKLEKRGIVIKTPPPRKRMPREKKWLIALIAALCVMAITCSVFGGILLSRAIDAWRTDPYASEYETLTMENYLVTDSMGKTFYTGNTFDFSGIAAAYAPKDLSYMDEYIEALRLENRVLVKQGQKLTPIGMADDVAIYIIDIFKGGSDGERISTTLLPKGNYAASINFRVGDGEFSRAFDEALIALNVKPAETGRAVRYNGEVSLSDTVCITYAFYKSDGKITVAEGEEEPADILDRYKWSTTANKTYSKEKVRAEMETDVEDVLAAALIENCPAIGEGYSFVLEDYTLSGNTADKAVYRVDAQIHFVVEEEVTKDITFTFPSDFFTAGDGAERMALNGQTVTFRIIIAGTDDYELPAFDRKFITETLKFEVAATDDAGAVAEYKEKRLAEINVELEEVKRSYMLRQSFLNLSEKAQKDSLYITNSYPQSLKQSIRQTALQNLQNRFVAAYGYLPSETELNAFAAEAAYADSGGAITTVKTYSEYLEIAVQSEISQELIMYYVFRDADLEITDEALVAAYDAYVEKMVESAGDPDKYNKEYFINYYGEEALYKKVRRDLVYEAVGSYLLENNVGKMN